MYMKKELFLIVGHCNVEQEFNSAFKKIPRKKRSKDTCIKVPFRLRLRKWLNTVSIIIILWVSYKSPIFGRLF